MRRADQALKSRVRGAANLSSIIEQQQCLAFAEKFNFIIISPTNSRNEFRAPQYPDRFAFFHLKNERYQLSETEMKALQGYYRAKYDIPLGSDCEFREMEKTVQLWHGAMATLPSNATERAAKIPPA